MVDQVKDLDPRNQYTATAGQTIFPYTFPIFDKDDLVVIQEGTTLTEGTDYTVSGVGDEDGGNVTLTTGATTGDTITIYRDIALERLVDYQDSGDFLASDVNDDFDRQLFMIQQLNRDVQRGLRFSQDDEITSTQIGNLNTRANKLLAFDASGEITYQASTTLSPVADSLVDTVASAKALNLAIGDYVRTGGYTSFNDGGGALYRVVAGGTGTDDGGSYHDMSNGNQLELIHSGVINVKQFGALEGIANNATGPFQAAVDYGSAQGVPVYVPSGEYYLNTVNIDSNTNLYGDGVNSKLYLISDALTTRRMLFIEGLTGDLKTNITIKNLWLEGTVVADGFSEFRHLMYMFGVENVLVEGCHFVGFQGDGMGIVWTSLTEGNKNITVRDCVFDGVNNDNRNGISVIGCEQLLIENNYFKNISNSFSPGAIDIEPNPGYGAFVTIDSITVRKNRFVNISGNVGALSFFNPEASEDWVGHPVNLTFEDNSFEGVFRGIFVGQLQTANRDNTNENLNLKVSNNKVVSATDRSFWVYGVKGVVLENNYFEGGANGSRIGWSDANRGVYDVKVKGNFFKDEGGTDGYAMQVYQSEELKFLENTFMDIGVTGGGFGVLLNFGSGTSSKIKFEDNVVTNATGRITGGITASGGSIASGDNTLIGNRLGSLSVSALPIDYSDYGESTSETGITALAGGQAGAYQLTKSVNIVTGGAAFDSVKLPTAEQNNRLIVINNRAGVSIQVYPSSGDDLGQGLNAPESIANGDTKAYRSINTTDWVRVSGL